MYIYLAGKQILPLQFELKPYENELPPHCRPNYLEVHLNGANIS